MTNFLTYLFVFLTATFSCTFVANLTLSAVKQAKFRVENTLALGACITILYALLKS